MTRVTWIGCSVAGLVALALYVLLGAAKPAGETLETPHRAQDSSLDSHGLGRRGSREEALGGEVRISVRGAPDT